jgi:hypothetical protein
MTKSDVDMLLEMGFEQARAELAVKKTGGRQYSMLSFDRGTLLDADKTQCNKH